MSKDITTILLKFGIPAAIGIYFYNKFRVPDAISAFNDTVDTLNTGVNSGVQTMADRYIGVNSNNPILQGQEEFYLYQLERLGLTWEDYIKLRTFENNWSDVDLLYLDSWGININDTSILKSIQNDTDTAVLTVLKNIDQNFVLNEPLDLLRLFRAGAMPGDDFEEMIEYYNQDYYGDFE